MLLLAAGDSAERDWRKAVSARQVFSSASEAVHLSFRQADVDRYQNVKAVLAVAGVRQEPLQICRRSSSRSLIL